MSNIQKKSSGGIGEWWDDRPTWQKWGIGIGGTVLVGAGAGAAVYAVVTYGASITISTSAVRITAAIGRAAIQNGAAAV